MGVEFLVNVGQVLGVFLEEIGVYNLKVIGLDLSPAYAARVLSEVYKLSLSGSDEDEREQYADYQGIYGS